MSRILVASLFIIATTSAVDSLPDKAMGDWSADGAPAVQVIPMGDGKYRAHIFPAFATGQEPLAVLVGTGKDGQVTFTGEADGAQENNSAKENSWWPAPAGSKAWSGAIANGVFTLNQPGKPAAQLKPVDRSSPTLGAKPPAGAVVLLGPDTTDLSQTWGTFKDGKITGPCPWTLDAGGVMTCIPAKGDIASKAVFGDCRLHLEFRLAFEPSNRGQDRSNSGLFIQERFELQILDSYGLMGLFNETGSLYRSVKPLVNACLPPGMWQTYDVDFTAAKVAGTKVVKGAVFNVQLNGVLVQKDATLDHCTGARSKRQLTNDPGPILLQDHNHPVAYRNIWVLEKR
jgi:hypothetical protein